MNKADLRSLIAVPLVILIAIGLAAAGSQGGNEVFGIPIFTLGVAAAFIIQWIAFIPAYLYKTEKFYDLTGSITYITVILGAVLLSPSPDGRALILMGIIVVWAVRLGSFLFLRIRAAGEDSRFREVKTSFTRFLLYWTVQGLWIVFSLGAALAAITSEIQAELGVFALVGFLVWLLGFSIEVVSDRQKSAFKSNPENKDKFINVGLWSWSRHPNYFGEIILWIGVAITAIPVLSGWQWVTMISPVFIFILLTRISGVPLLEKRADEKWGGQNEYEDYKARTSILVPRPPKPTK